MVLRGGIKQVLQAGVASFLTILARPKLRIAVIAKRIFDDALRRVFIGIVVDPEPVVVVPNIASAIAQEFQIVVGVDVVVV